MHVFFFFKDLLLLSIWQTLVGTWFGCDMMWDATAMKAC